MIDWEAQRVTCPAGQQSVRWAPNHDRTNRDLTKVAFKKTTCLSCQQRQQCTRSPTGPRESLLRPRSQHEALVAARKEQLTSEWKRKYERRAGIEGTISQGVRAFGLRQARYIGQAKTHLQNILTAAAINLGRVMAWINGSPSEKTRTPLLREAGTGHWLGVRQQYQQLTKAVLERAMQAELTDHLGYEKHVEEVRVGAVGRALVDVRVARAGCGCQ